LTGGGEKKTSPRKMPTGIGEGMVSKSGGNLKKNPQGKRKYRTGHLPLSGEEKRRKGIPLKRIPEESESSNEGQIESTVREGSGEGEKGK